VKKTSTIKRKAKSLILQWKVRHRNKPKVFVIGFNKTGTTSVKHALGELGFIIGNQPTAELLLDHIIDDEQEIFEKKIIEYCNEAEAYQDIPFSLPQVYKILDENFPDSKFILTIRDNSDQWFNSIKRFHAKLWGGGDICTKEDLANAKYRYKGYALRYINYVFGDSYYNKKKYHKVYEKHISDVQKHFYNRPEKLLTINISDEKSYIKMCNFLEVVPKRNNFEWKNRT
jgi:hypothetical protein